MNKKEFISELNEYLDEIEKVEKERIISYYEELIEDKIDDGEYEEEVIQNLGKPKDIAKTVLKETSIKNKTNNYLKEILYDQDVDEIDTIDIDSIEFNIRIVKSNDYLVRVNYYRSDTYNFDVYKKGRKLKIKYKSNGNKIFFGSFFNKTDLELVIEIPENRLDTLKINNVSGKVTLENIALEKKLSISTVSGKVKFINVSAPKISIDAVTANINAHKLLADKVSINGVSSKIELLMIGRFEEYKQHLSQLLNDRYISKYGEKEISISTVVSTPSIMFTEE